jgi:hypothetical protein
MSFHEGPKDLSSLTSCSTFPIAMFKDLLNDELVVPSGQQSRGYVAKEVSGLEHAKVLSRRIIDEGGKLSEKAALKERDINKSRVNEQFHLRWGGMSKSMDFEMAFPGFEDDFDAPTYPVDPAHRPGIPGLLGDVGEKDLPSEKGQMGWIGLSRLSLLWRSFPSLAGNRLRDRNGYHPDGSLSSLRQGVSSSSVFLQAAEEIKAFAGRVEESHFMRIATQVERFVLTNGSEDTKGRVTQVADHQISLSDDIQDGRRGALVVAPVSSELK